MTKKTGHLFDFSVRRANFYSKNSVFFMFFDKKKLSARTFNSWEMICKKHKKNSKSFTFLQIFQGIPGKKTVFFLKKMWKKCVFLHIYISNPALFFCFRKCSFLTLFEWIYISNPAILKLWQNVLLLLSLLHFFEFFNL